MTKIVAYAFSLTLLSLGLAQAKQAQNPIDVKDLKGAAAALGSTSSADRAAGLSFIAILGPEAKGTTRQVVGALFDTSPDVRDWASKALGKVDPMLYAPVMALVQGQDPAQQLKALQQIGQMGDNGVAAVPALLAFFEKAKGNDRTAAVTALGQIGTKDATLSKVLANIAMKDPDPNVRKVALAAVPKLDNPQGAVEAFGAMLSDADPANRSAAVNALAGLAGKNKQALSVLQKVMQSDPSPTVRAAAQQAVANLQKK